MFTPVAGGTVDFVVNAAVQGFMTPALAGAPTGVYKYRAESTDLSQWEIGEGTYTSGTTTLTRTTVLYNSAGTGTAAGQSGAGTKINFTVEPNVGIVQAVEDTLCIDQSNSWTSAQKAQARSNMSAVLRGHIGGLTLSTAGASATFGIAAGEAADSDGVDLLSLASAFTKTTSAWAVGTGNGALDTGTIANNTWYKVFQIKRPDTGVVDVAITTNALATGPTTGGNIPAAYTVKRYIGSMKTNGSGQWTLFVQVGDTFLWAVPTQDTTATVGTTADLITLNVPLGLSVEAIIFGLSVNAATATTWAITSPLQTDTLPALSMFTGIQGTASENGQYSMRVLTNASAQVRRRASAASTSIYINTFGWVDTRGRHL